MSKLQIERISAFAPIKVVVYLENEQEAREFAFAQNQKNMLARNVRLQIERELRATRAEPKPIKEEEEVPFTTIQQWLKDKEAGTQEALLRDHLNHSSKENK